MNAVTPIIALGDSDVIPLEEPTHLGAGLAPAGAILESHLRLDAAMDETLVQVVGDTESSALAIMKQIRLLHDTASKLVAYLNGSGLTAGDLGDQIIASVAYLADIGSFIQRLPGKMERDLKGVQTIVKEIADLSGMVESVKSISMQSHMLAINAAIEAAHAGIAGESFGVVAGQMRTLATDSREVATQITQGLDRARRVVEGSIAAGIADSSQQFAAVSDAAASIQKVRDNFEDMRQFSKTRFAVVTQHNEDLVKEIAEVLGQIQYQDVVRQSIERLRSAIGRRNSTYQLALGADPDGSAVAALPEQLDLLLHEYVEGEAAHRHSARAADGGTEATAGASTELKIELF